jgi:hypothetical protein
MTRPFWPDQLARSAAAGSPIGEVAARIMDDPIYLAAALAWLAVARPGSGLQRDEPWLHMHLRLFGWDERYWRRLCRLFTALGMGD